MMVHRLPKRVDRPLRLLGWSSIVLSVILNPFLLAGLFSPDHVIGFPNSALIVCVEVILLLWGSGLLFFKKRNIRVVNWLTGCAIAALLLLFTEVVCYFIYQSTTAQEVKTEEPRLYKRDPQLGHTLIPNMEVTATKTIDGETVFSATYSIDGHAKRQVPMLSGASAFWAFFGGSTCFGEGLDDHQTIAAKAQSMLDSTQVYNLAVGGYGTHQVFKKITDNPKAWGIEQTKGAGIYIFIDDHINRNIGTMHVYNEWGQDMPNFELTDNGLMQQGTFTTGRKMKAFWYNLLGKSYLLRLFNFNLPAKISEPHLVLTAALINESSTAFRQHFPNGKFYVLFYPNCKYAAELTALINPEVGILDYSNLFDRHQPPYHIANDGHPSELANEIVAEKIVRDLSPGNGSGFE